MFNTEIRLKRQHTENQITAAVRYSVINFSFFSTITTTVIIYDRSSNVCRGDSCVTSFGHAKSVPCCLAAGLARTHAAL